MYTIFRLSNGSSVEPRLADRPHQQVGFDRLCETDQKLVRRLGEGLV
jgi:hypothetical protein